MASFNFPNNPAVNSTHTENGVSFKWNGSIWERLAAAGQQGFQGVQGATGQQGVQGSQGFQ